jgi:hypothetical protein
MNKNLYIRNLPEGPKENARNVIKGYLQNKKVKDDSYDIDIVHRTGKYDSKNARHRPMVVQVAKRGQVDAIMAATKGDGEFNRDHTRITRQVPTEMRHATAKLHHIAKLIKDKHPHANVYVKEQNLYVNNQKHTATVVPPTLKETLTTDPNEIDIMNNVAFFASDLVGHKGSTFVAYASPICNPEDARYAYLAVSRFPEVAGCSHLISAYISMEEDFDYFDDGDHGLGRHIFDIIHSRQIEGVIVFLARDYGGVHLGKDRYTIINRVVAQALGRLNAAIQRNPKIQHPSRMEIHSKAQGDQPQNHLGVPPHTSFPPGSPSQPPPPFNQQQTLEQWGQSNAHDSWGQPNTQGAAVSAQTDNLPKLIIKSPGSQNSDQEKTNTNAESKQLVDYDVDGTKAKSGADQSCDMDVQISDIEAQSQISDDNDHLSTGGKVISKPFDLPQNAPPPFAQFNNKYPKSRSAPQSPITIQSQSSDSISLPTAGSVNAFHLMKMAKQNVKTKDKNKKKANKSSSVTGPIPGINKIKSPISQVDKQASKAQASPKRTREQMEGKSETKDTNDM